MTSAVELINMIREGVTNKPPGPSELLFWVYHLRQLGFQRSRSLKEVQDSEHRKALERSLGILLKNQEDRSQAIQVLGLQKDLGA